MSDIDPLFIDADATVYRGREAETRLARKASSVQPDPKRGIVRVDRERWLEAQRYERTSWLRRGRRVGDDRNQDHRERFANYAPLAGMRFRRAMELGCGPFTNMRLILEHAHAEAVHLLDPLLNDYLHHPLCRYKGGRLGGILRLPNLASLWQWRRPLAAAGEVVNRARVGGWRGRRVILEATPIEEYQVTLRFDLVVLVNVIEHCSDASVVFDKVHQMLEPGGVFVFADKLYDATALVPFLSRVYDAGHPLRVDRSVIDAYLARHFETLMRAEYRTGGSDEDRAAPYDLAFIGRKNT